LPEVVIRISVRFPMLDFRPGQARARKFRQRFDFAITGDIRTTLFVKAVLVVDVDPGSPAADYLTQGDVMLSVNPPPGELGGRIQQFGGGSERSSFAQDRSLG